MKRNEKHIEPIQASEGDIGIASFSSWYPSKFLLKLAIDETLFDLLGLWGNLYSKNFHRNAEGLSSNSEN